MYNSFYSYFLKNKYSIILVSILLLGSFLRLFKLDFQSMWLDELFSLIETNPELTWKETFKMVFPTGQHPPLFYIILKSTLSTFGYSDWVARFIAAFAGIIGMYFIYVFAKEIMNKKIGLIAALFCSINYFHLAYSQEARMYSFVFLFSILSSLYFIRLIKNPSFAASLKYVLAALCLTWFHYLAVLILISHAVLGLVILIKIDSTKRMPLIKRFLLILVVFSTGMLPLLEQIKLLASTTTFWTTGPSSYFYIDIFAAFFGYSGTTSVLMFVCFSFFLYTSFLTKENYNLIGLNIPLVLFILVLIPIGLGYIRSITSTSIMVDRYFIGILPYIIIIIAGGVEAIVNRQMKYGIISLIIIASFIIILFEQKYYTSPKKDDFKGVVEFIKRKTNENDSNYFVISDKNWHFNYYYNRYQMHPKKIDCQNLTYNFTTDKIYSNHLLVIDTNLKDIWIVAAHHSNLLEMRHISDTLIASNRFTLKDTFISKDAFTNHFIRNY